MPPESEPDTPRSVGDEKDLSAAQSNGSLEKQPSQSFVDESFEYDATFEDPPLLTVLSVYLGLALLVLFGHLRDILRRWGFDKTMTESKENTNEGFVPLYNDFESFYTRNVYQRVCHLWCYPLAGLPGAEIEVWDRHFDNYNERPRLLKTKKKFINIGSYNYLGYSEPNGASANDAMDEIRNGYGSASGSSLSELGTMTLHRQLESLVSKFVGKEDAIIFGMGFATNALNLPSLVTSGCLLISDELNHASLVMGARLSGAKIKVFKHNDMKCLENLLRTAVIEGQPRTRRPWKKILIVVEGVYSMEGTTCNLPEIIALKKKYKAYLYIDEAHSIGALGKRGRGVCDQFGVDPRDVDILMGTFSKSFAAAGGYIAANKKIIAHLRKESYDFNYGTSITPPVCRQVLSSMQSLMGLNPKDDGLKRLQRLQENTRFFRRELKKRGYIIYGEEGSPVIPALAFTIASTCAFGMEALRRGLATVLVGFPATPLLGSRIRFCMSAGLSKENLDKILAILDDMEATLGLRLSRRKLKARK